MNVKQMEEQYKNLLVLGSKIRDKYEGKSENMSAQEENEFSNITAELDALSVKIETQKKFDRAMKWADEPSSPGLPMGGGDANSGNPAYKAAKFQEEAQATSRKAWTKFLVGGKMALDPAEIKAYQADNPVSGGFLVAPQDFVQELIVLVKDQLFMRQMAKVYTVNRAESLGLPALDTDPSDADWTAELLTGSEESTLATSKRELRPHPVGKLIRVSNKLLRAGMVNTESEILDRMAYKFAVTQEKAFLVGSGADQPLGVFTASSLGIDTSRDVTAATTTAVAADDFISTKYKLKGQYQQRAAWIMHRDVVAATRKLKDNNNNYLWTTGLTNFGGATGPGNGLQGTPERLLDCPICMSEYSPNTFTTGLYMAVLGDFSRYVIADSLDMQWQVNFGLAA